MVHLDPEATRMPHLVRIWDQLSLMIIPRALHMMHLEIHQYLFAGKENIVSLTLLDSSYVLLWDMNLGCWNTSPMSGVSASVVCKSGSVRRTEYKIETLEGLKWKLSWLTMLKASSKEVHYTQITAFHSTFSKRWTFHFCWTEEGLVGLWKNWEMA